jgi:hypothetical protein
LHDDVVKAGDGYVTPYGRDAFGGVKVFRVVYNESCESRSKWFLDGF